ncbi:MAG: N-formylglutamate amidohydrolase [Pararhodobacter sp.]
MPLAVRIFEPETAPGGVVFGSPHSGRHYPSEFLLAARVDPLTLRSSEDAYVDLLLADAPRHGATLITTDVPRAYVDFNRADTELDPALIDGAPRSGLNPRVGSGLGVLARVVAGARPIYSGKLSLAEAHARLDQYWYPYHAALADLLERQRQMVGGVLLCDVHSMPSEALQAGLIRNARRPEVILGDRYGAACSPALMNEIEAIFRAAGLRVARNAPFAGAYILQRYGRPQAGCHAVQIEIDRALYLDERRVVPGARFDAFRLLMSGITESLSRLGQECGWQAPGSGMDLAAE